MNLFCWFFTNEAASNPVNLTSFSSSGSHCGLDIYMERNTQHLQAQAVEKVAIKQKGSDVIYEEEHILLLPAAWFCENTLLSWAVPLLYWNSSTACFLDNSLPKNLKGLRSSMKRIYKYPTVTAWYHVHYIYAQTDLLESMHPKSMQFSSSNNHKIVLIQERAWGK